MTVQQSQPDTSEPAPELTNAEKMELHYYSETMVWVAEFVRRRARSGVETEEALQAQVQKDLKHLLDQTWEPH